MVNGTTIDSIEPPPHARGVMAISMASAGAMHDVPVKVAGYRCGCKTKSIMCDAATCK